MPRDPQTALSPSAARGTASVTLPASSSRDPTVYERERTPIFGREWIAFADPDDPANDDVVRISTVVVEEDHAIVEAVQRNLDAGVYDTGRLSPRHESGVAQFQTLVREALHRADATAAP